MVIVLELRIIITLDWIYLEKRIVLLRLFLLLRTGDDVRPRVTRR